MPHRVSGSVDTAASAAPAAAAASEAAAAAATRASVFLESAMAEITDAAAAALAAALIAAFDEPPPATAEPAFPLGGVADALRGPAPGEGGGGRLNVPAPGLKKEPAGAETGRENITSCGRCRCWCGIPWPMAGCACWGLGFTLAATLAACCCLWESELSRKPWLGIPGGRCGLGRYAIGCMTG